MLYFVLEYNYPYEGHGTPQTTRWLTINVLLFIKRLEMNVYAYPTKNRFEKWEVPPIQMNSNLSYRCPRSTSGKTTHRALFTLPKSARSAGFWTPWPITPTSLSNSTGTRGRNAYGGFQASSSGSPMFDISPMLLNDAILYASSQSRLTQVAQVISSEACFPNLSSAVSLNFRAGGVVEGLMMSDHVAFRRSYTAAGFSIPASDGSGYLGSYTLFMLSA
ncbi:hypothetical protein BJ742DRAFT_477573 [Cladochytrium replicatum]|nr:hypothetical protein BJ742DRAFT_477573 [Cladochytrium replicatum]